MSDRNTLAGMSVLVVDDERLLQRRLAAHLEAIGADVTVAGDVASARSSLRQQDFDFILLDINLPDGTGTDLLKEGAFQPGQAVIVMTAEGGVEVAVETMRLGAADFLSKPFEPAVLPLVMRRARQLRRLTHSIEFFKFVDCFSDPTCLLHSPSTFHHGPPWAAPAYPSVAVRFQRLAAVAFSGLSTLNYAISTPSPSHL